MDLRGCGSPPARRWPASPGELVRRGATAYDRAVNLKGIFPPIPTPFSNGEVDLRALASNIGRWMQTRLPGLVILGSNGEAPLLEDAEADAILETARKGIPDSKTMIAGVGRESTAATIAAAKRAASIGADAVLVRTPSFYKNVMSTDAFVRHYSAVADASPLPVLLYNVTIFTGVNLLPEAVERLAHHGNIVGMKESNISSRARQTISSCWRDRGRHFMRRSQRAQRARCWPSRMCCRTCPSTCTKWCRKGGTAKRSPCNVA